MTSIEERVKAIEERNCRVELDKAWETSIARKIILAVLTYFVILVFFIVAELPYPFLSALVPSAAFIFSTLSLPYFKTVWISRKSA